MFVGPIFDVAYRRLVGVRCNFLTGRENAVVSAKGEKRSQFAFQLGKKPLSDAQKQPEFPQIKGDNMQGDGTFTSRQEVNCMISPEGEAIIVPITLLSG